MNIPRAIRLLLTVLLVLPGVAQANVGKVLYAAGPVTVERTETLELKKGDTLLQGDIVVTGSRARAQLLMVDGARISVRAGTRLAHQRYPAAMRLDHQAHVTEPETETLHVVPVARRHPEVLVERPLLVVRARPGAACQPRAAPRTSACRGH